MIGPDELMSLRRAADAGDAALDLALLRIGILAPADLQEIRDVLQRPTVCLEPTRNCDGHLIIEVVERGVLVAQLHNDGRILHVAGHSTAA